MPIHDWTRTHAESAHSHHISWTAALSGLLNRGWLPTRYYSMIQSHHAAIPLAHAEPSKGRHRTLGLFREEGHRLVAVVEQTTPLMASRPAELSDFLRRVAARIRLGIHTLVVDIHPPTQEYVPEAFDRLAARIVIEGDGPLAVTSFDATAEVIAHRVRFAVGDDMAQARLRLAPDVCVLLPLQAAYDAAFAGSPPYLRKLLAADSEKHTAP